MERAIPILPTEDLAAAKTFYVDRLGFKVTFEVSEDGHSGWLGIALGTIAMTLDSPMNGHGRNACVALQVDDADRYYRHWRSKVDILRAPKNEDWVRVHSICSIHPAIPSSSWVPWLRNDQFSCGWNGKSSNSARNVRPPISRGRIPALHQPLVFLPIARLNPLA